jgi:hypothetical protein
MNSMAKNAQPSCNISQILHNYRTTKQIMHNFLPISPNILTFEETIKNKHTMDKISNSILTVEISGQRTANLLRRNGTKKILYE